VKQFSAEAIETQIQLSAEGICGICNRETETTSTRLLDEVHHLHPNLQFCGEPRNAILSISEDILIQNL